MNLYAYVRPYDDGKYANHAPHVSRGLWSLANCVWQMRQAVKEGDWVIALTSVGKYSDGRRRVSYLARVNRKITRQIYWNEYSRFRDKQHGRQDNYYEPSITEPFFLQHPNPYHTTKDDDMGKDLKSPFILLSREFRDFGAKTLTFPPTHWAPIISALEPPRSRGYRKFAVRSVDLNTLAVDLA